MRIDGHPLMLQCCAVLKTMIILWTAKHHEQLLQLVPTVMFGPQVIAKDSQPSGFWVQVKLPTKSVSALKYVKTVEKVLERSKPLKHQLSLTFSELHPPAHVQVCN